MPPGRPRILDDVKRAEICALLNAGLEFTETARYVGCTPRTIRREISRNAVFRREVHDALLAARVAPEKLLRQAAGRNWRAAAWLLERTEPQLYGRGAATPACTIEDLEAACSWIIEVVLHAADFPQRDDLFDRTYAVVQKVKNQIALRTNPKKPLHKPPTVFYDLCILSRQVGPAPFGRDELSARGETAADKSRPSSVPAFDDESSENLGPAAADDGHKSGILSAQSYSPRVQHPACNAESTPTLNSRSA